MTKEEIQQLCETFSKEHNIIMKADVNGNTAYVSVKKKNKKKAFITNTSQFLNSVNMELGQFLLDTTRKK